MIPDRRAEANGGTALRGPRLTSIIVIGGRSIIVTTLSELQSCRAFDIRRAGAAVAREGFAGGLRSVRDHVVG
jgi:hypothetical protein